MKNEALQNSHINSHINPVLSSAAPAPHNTSEAARHLLPPSVRNRKFRAHSFASKLAPAQLATLCAWLSTDSTAAVCQKIATPPPAGFGLEVSPTTLDRLKRTLRNISFQSWVSGAMDTACDLIDSDDGTEVAPLREALSVMLYSRAVAITETNAPIENIDRLLSAITKLEKIKIAAALATATRRSATAPATRHRVELTIVPGSINDQTRTPKLINISTDPTPPNDQSET
jgi:hypothetical protein